VARHHQRIIPRIVFLAFGLPTLFGLPATGWREYGHPILLVETFVDNSRFQGICYRAANWLRLGETTGRTRNDRWNRAIAPVKDVYAYALHRQALEKLRDPS
jgi:hypothetical protein